MKDFEKNKDYSEKLEKAILSACMLSTKNFQRTYKKIDPCYFYYSDHEFLYSCFVEMFESGIPVDYVSTMDYIMRKKKRKTIKNKTIAAYLVSIDLDMLPSENVEYNCRILNEMYISRQLKVLTQSGVSGEDNDKEILKLTQKLSQLSRNKTKEDWASMLDVMVGLSKHQDEIKKTEGIGVTTGIKKLDNISGGFFPGNFVILAARPGTGKTAFAIQIMRHITDRDDTVGFISLEMNNNEVGARIASQDSGIPFGNIFRNKFENEGERKVYNNTIAEITSNRKIYTSEKTGVNELQIRASLIQLKNDHPELKCVIIDYLQLIEGSAKDVRLEQLRRISAMCKNTAKELRIPIIALAQMNREFRNRTGNARLPKIEDLRGTGNFEQDADVIMFLHSRFNDGETEDENGESTEGKIMLIVRKWRNSEANIFVELYFDGKTMRFFEEKPNMFNNMF